MTTAAWFGAVERTGIARAVAAYVCKRYPAGALIYEDAVQLALITMAAAIPGHAGRASLDTYCWNAAYYVLAREAQRGARRVAAEVPGVVVEPSDGGEGARVAGMAPSVAELLARLPEVERRVIEARYGLGGRPAQSLAEIAADLGLSRQRIGQIEHRALARMRD